MSETLEGLRASIEEEQRESPIWTDGREIPLELLVKAIFAGHPGMLERDVRYRVVFPEIVEELEQAVKGYGKEQVYKEIKEEYDSYFPWRSQRSKH